jgi:hypothetical protein
MSNLITRHYINATSTLGPSWYFPDAYFSVDARAYKYAWPNPAFPAHVAINDDDMTNARRIEIRRWIEQHVAGTVIADFPDKSYRIYFNDKYEWGKHWEINNKWHVFYFVLKQDAMMFKLAFSEYVKPLTDTHPTRHEGFIKPDHIPFT